MNPIPVMDPTALERQRVYQDYALRHEAQILQLAKAGFGQEGRGAVNLHWNTKELVYLSRRGLLDHGLTGTVFVGDEKEKRILSDMDSYDPNQEVLLVIIEVVGENLADFCLLRRTPISIKC